MSLLAQNVNLVDARALDQRFPSLLALITLEAPSTVVSYPHRLPTSVLRVQQNRPQDFSLPDMYRRDRGGEIEDAGMLNS